MAYEKLPRQAADMELPLQIPPLPQPQGTPAAAADRPQFATMSIDERLAYLKIPIAHPRAQQAKDELKTALQEPGGASIITLFGPARVGKTVATKRVIEDITTELLPHLEVDRERIPFGYVSLRPPLKAPFRWRNYFTCALEALEEPAIDQKILIDLPGNDEDANGRNPRFGPIQRQKIRNARVSGWRAESSEEALRAALETTIRYRRPLGMIIDEGQHLGNLSSGPRLENQLDCIKSMADITETVHVLVGTYSLLELHDLSAQLIGRSIDIHFPRYRTTSQDLEDFRNILRTFQTRLPFEEETDVLIRNWEFCYERSIGCVGAVHMMLVRATREALARGAQSLSFAQLERFAFTPAQSYQMLEEARWAEDELVANPVHLVRLQQKLGLPGHTTVVPPSPPEPPCTPSGEPPTAADAIPAESPPEHVDPAVDPAEDQGDPRGKAARPSGSHLDRDQSNKRRERITNARKARLGVDQPATSPKAHAPRRVGQRKAVRDPVGHHLPSQG